MDIVQFKLTVSVQRPLNDFIAEDFKIRPFLFIVMLALAGAQQPSLQSKECAFTEISKNRPPMH